MSEVRSHRPVLLLATGLAMLGLVGTAGGSPARGQVVTRTLWSAALGRRERVVVYLPPGYAGARAARYPLVILLHGVPGRPEDFVTHGVVPHIDALMAAGRIPPFVAAMPAGGDRPTDDNEWADSDLRPSERWETYVARDVVGFLQSHYRVRRDAAGRAIAGESMGGFGAMNLALHHRNLVFPKIALDIPNFRAQRTHHADLVRRGVMIDNGNEAQAAEGAPIFDC